MVLDSVVSVIVPCHNEEKTLGTVLDKLHGLNIPKQIILVNDGSTDNTVDVIVSHRDQIDVLVTLPNNRGKGAAIQEGLNHVTGDVVIIQDADLEYDVDNIPIVIAPILQGNADVVYGSRFLVTKEKGHFINYLANKFFTRAYAKKTGWPLTDVHTCQKAAKTSFIKEISLTENQFGFDVEFTIKLAQLTNRFMEVPVSYLPRSKKEGKHIGITDGFRGLYVLVKL